MKKTLSKVFREGKPSGSRKATEPYELKLKARIIKAYLRGEKSFRMLGKQYGINPGILSRWVRVCTNGHPVKSKQIKITKFTAMGKKIEKTTQQLRQEIKMLKKQLEEEKLKTLVYQKIIEKDYRLDITKKYAARRPVKSGK
jgi:transposase-like protein